MQNCKHINLAANAEFHQRCEAGTMSGGMTG